MAVHPDEQISTTPPTLYAHRHYIHPLRALFDSLQYDLSLGAYPTAPPPLRRSCRTARQHVHSISRNTKNLLPPVAHVLKLLHLIISEKLDAQLSVWHELLSQHRFEAYWERLGGTRLKPPVYPVENRVCILLGYLLSPGKEQREWVEWDGEQRGWRELDEEYGGFGRAVYEAAKGIL